MFVGLEWNAQQLHLEIVLGCPHIFGHVGLKSATFQSNKTYEKSKCSWRLESLERLVWAQYVCVTPTDQAAPVWMCLMSPRASCVPPTGSPLSQQPRRVCSTYAAGSLRLGGVWYPWCWKPTLDLHGKTTSPVGVRCVVVGGVMTRGWGGGLVYQMNMCQEAHTQTDRQTKAHSFLPPPSLFDLFCFVLFSAAPLFCCSVSEMRLKTPRFVVCLPLTSVCLYHVLPAPLSLPLLTSFASSVLFPLLSLFLSPLCVQSLCLSSTWAILSL